MGQSLASQTREQLYKHDLDIIAAFVPQCLSPSHDSSQLSLNWRVGLTLTGRVVLVADYSTDVAHMIGYERVKHNRDVLRSAANGARGAHRIDKLAVLEFFFREFHDQLIDLLGFSVVSEIGAILRHY
jgi:hypothetical protein